MKKLLFFMLLCTAAFGFQACSSDDDPSSLPPTPENIMGEWVPIEEEYWEEHIWVIENFTGRVEVYVDGELEGIDRFDYTIDGNDFTFIWEDGERATVKLVDIRENSLVFESDGEIVTLIRRGSNDDDNEDNNDGDNEDNNDGDNEDNNGSSLPPTPENIMGEWVFIEEEYYREEHIWVIENFTGRVEVYVDGELEGIDRFDYTIDGNDFTFIWEYGERETVKLVDIRENSLVFEDDGEIATLIRRGSNDDDNEDNNDGGNEDNNGGSVNSIYGSWKYEWGDPDGEYVIYHLAYDGTGYTQVMDSSVSPEETIQPFTFIIEGNTIIATGSIVNKIEIISIKGNTATLLIDDEMRAEMTRIDY